VSYIHEFRPHRDQEYFCARWLTVGHGRGHQSSAPPFPSREEYDMDDATLKQMVIDELAWRPDIDSAHIGVTADKGVVTLSGYVGSYPQKYEAEQAIKRIAGVRGVAEELEVRYPGDYSTKDDEIADRALNSLAWSASVPRNSVKVMVEKGMVTLSGQVRWQFERNAAEDAVSTLYGVTDVVNNITLKAQQQPTDVKSRIESALKRCAELDSDAIRVSVSDGTVTLAGTVDSWAARDIAEEAAWAAPGVRSVQDLLSVL
jgi:osmotically-inducible protein OsmY